MRRLPLTIETANHLSRFEDALAVLLFPSDLLCIFPEPAARSQLADVTLPAALRFFHVIALLHLSLIHI